jgi:hypothetical protein
VGLTNPRPPGSAQLYSTADDLRQKYVAWRSGTPSQRDATRPDAHFPSPIETATQIAVSIQFSGAA